MRLSRDKENAHETNFLRSFSTFAVFRADAAPCGCSRQRHHPSCRAVLRFHGAFVGNAGKQRRLCLWQHERHGFLARTVHRSIRHHRQGGWNRLHGHGRLRRRRIYILGRHAGHSSVRRADHLQGVPLLRRFCSEAKRRRQPDCSKLCRAGRLCERCASPRNDAKLAGRGAEGAGGLCAFLCARQSEQAQIARL